MHYSQLGKVILIGDLNSRTALRPDFNDDESVDHYIPVYDNYISDSQNILPIRHNKDKSILKGYGRALLNLCIESELRILNGRTMGVLGTILFS